MPHGQTYHRGQDGRDMPIGSPSSNNKILLSTVGSDARVHYSVIAMPESYMEAYQKATIVFPAHLSGANAKPEKVVLKYAMKSALGYAVWAAIDPSSWVDIVQHGNEVRVEVAGAVPATELSPAQWTESFLPDTTLTFRYEVDGMPTFATTLFPKTYQSARNAAIALFHLNKRNAVSLELWIPDAKGHCSATKVIHPSQWPLIILQTAQKNPQFEISVKSPNLFPLPSFSTLLGYSFLLYIVVTLLGGSPPPPCPKCVWG